jgi:hypothetical protein
MRTRVSCIALALAIGAARSGQSQEQSGSIAGRVVLDRGNPAGGVRIVAEGRSGFTGREQATNPSGYFRFPALPVGTYRLRLSFVGYRPLAVDSVVVMLGRTTSAGVLQLEPQAYELGEMVVTAAPPLVDVSSTTTATNITSRQFETIPTERDFRSVVPLAAQANSSFLDEDEANVAGGTGPENAYFLDGVDISDPFRGVSSSSLPYNFIREVQVKAGGYEAEYGRATGGIINVITHTGSNRFAGQLFGFFTGDELSASPKFAVAGARENQFSTYDVGGSLGGPIVKDRLWFFAAYNPSFRREVVEAPGSTLPHQGGTQHLFATKLSWSAGPRTDVTFTIHGDPSTRRDVGVAGVTGSVLNAESITDEGRAGGVLLSGLVRHQLGRHGLLELGVSRFGYTNNTDPLGGAGLAPHFTDATTGAVSGGLGILFHSEAERRGIRGSVSMSLGRHDLKSGVEYEDNRFEQLNDQTGDPGSPGGFITRFDDTTYTWMRALIEGKVRNRVPTFYAQDSWRLSDRLTLNLGLRWDGQYLVAQSTTAQSFTDQWQPRIGAIYQLGSQRAQKLFGSFGRFYEQLTLNMAVINYSNGVSVTQLLFDHDPRLDPGGGDTVFAVFEPEVQPRRDLEGQYFDELTLGYERALGSRLRAGIRGVARRLRWAVEDAFSVDSGMYQIGNPGRGNLGFTPRARRHYTALVLTLEKPDGRFNFLASYAISRTSGNYQGLYDYARDFLPAAPNTTSEFDFPEQYANSSGLLPNDRTHVAKFAGSYRVDGRLTAGTFVSWASGVPRDELGATPIGDGIHAYLRPRGSAGRNPSVLDLNLRLAYTLPAWSKGVAPRLSLDLLHLTNARTALRHDDVRFLTLDADGNQALLNPNYNHPRAFAPPMKARLGITVDIGESP